MPAGRPPKAAFKYTADGATIRDYFTKRRDVVASAKASRDGIAQINKELEAAGVHSGTLAIVHRLADMPPGRRGWHVSLLRRYLDVLAEELVDPEHQAEVATEEAAEKPNGTLGHNGGPSMSARECIGCGTSYEPDDPAQRYCSGECKRDVRETAKVDRRRGQAV